MTHYSPILATAGGLLINGSMDRYLRALDADKGQILWQTRLPSQVAVAGGGGAIAATGLGLTPEADTHTGGNAMYVFALPQ